MSRKELVTLNRTLAVKVGDKIEKVSAFTGAWKGIRNGDECEYVIYAIHLPMPVTMYPEHQPRLTFKKSTIAATQEVDA